MEHVTEKIKRLYAIVSELEQMFPGRKFTPDGHLVGSIGEVYAAERYNLKLFPASEETHDAINSDGRKVQIKATQGSNVGISSCPDYLIVIKIHPDGAFSEIYNGPGSMIWNAAGKMQKNGQRPIQLSKLKRLMESVSSEDKII